VVCAFVEPVAGLVAGRDRVKHQAYGDHLCLHCVQILLGVVSIDCFIRNIRVNLTSTLNVKELCRS